MGIVRNIELRIFEASKTFIMFRDTYFICGLIFCICIIAIVFGLRILRESRMSEHEMDNKKPGNDTRDRK